MPASLVPLTGNTYPVKNALKEMGAKWVAADKVWAIAAEKFDAARALIDGPDAAYRFVVAMQDGQYASERAAIKAALAPALANSPAGTIAEIGDTEVTIRFADGQSMTLPLVRAGSQLSIMRGPAPMANILREIDAPKPSAKPRRERGDGRSRMQREWDCQNGYGGEGGERDGCGW